VTRFYLVRHGETHWHAENRYAGVSDVDLTARGLDQARRLGVWAGKADLTEIWTSDLSRARRTAAACAQTTNAPLAVDVRLRELDFGAAEGLTRREIEQRFPGVAESFARDPVGHHLPGGEDPVQAASRFTECLRHITTRHPDGPVLVVAHSTVLRLALCSLIGVQLSEYRRLFPSVGNCALTEIRLQRDEVALLHFNVPIDGRGS
jgi:broad specificity phosphatase PhoE